MKKLLFLITLVVGLCTVSCNNKTEAGPQGEDAVKTICMFLNETAETVYPSDSTAVEEHRQNAKALLKDFSKIMEQDNSGYQLSQSEKESLNDAFLNFASSMSKAQGTSLTDEETIQFSAIAFQSNTLQDYTRFLEQVTTAIQ